MSDSDSSGSYYSAHSRQSSGSHHSASSSGYPSSTGNTGQSYSGYSASASGYASDSEGSDTEDASYAASTASYVGSSTSSAHSHASQQGASTTAQRWNTAAMAVPLAGQSIAQGMVAHYAGQGNDPATVRSGNAYGGTIGATAIAPMGAVAQQMYYAHQTHQNPGVRQPAFSPGIAAGNTIATVGWGAYGYGASGSAAENGTAPYWQAAGAATAAVGHTIAGLSSQQMHYPTADQQNNQGPGLPQYRQQVDPQYLARQAAQQQGGGYGNSATQATQHTGRHHGQAAQRRGRGGGGGGAA